MTITIKNTTILFLFIVTSLPVLAQRDILLYANQEEGVISLAGKWRFQLDPENVGMTEEWFKGIKPEETIELPGTTDEQCKGAPERKQDGRFTRIHAYRGAAWYQVDVDIPKGLVGKRLVFSMERTKVTQVWWDDKCVGRDNSLISTQYFELGDCVKPGRHILTVRVHNGQEENPPVGGNHQTSDGTQTNWNGILGKIQIKALDDVWIKDLKVYPEVDRKIAKVQVVLGNRLGGPLSGKLVLKMRSWNVEKPHVLKPVVVPVKNVGQDGMVEFDLQMSDSVQFWSEFTPALYRLSVEFKGKVRKRKFNDKKEVDFGMRKFHTIGTNFAINGKRIFLRGKHDGAVFPQKGYPPMNVEEWLRILKIIKSYGINHIRCHTWCPPAAAFEACDRLGIYMLPELPHWGGVGNKPKVMEGDVEQKTEVYDNTTEYLIKEGYRLLDEFGNHASFVMFEIGNELGGDRQEIASIIESFRKYDPRHLFAGGANTFLWAPQLSTADDYWTTTMTGGSYGSGIYKNTQGKEVRSSYPNHNVGHVNNILRGTDYDYSSGIKGINVPIISHENGQYQMYPNYKEFEKFTGVTRAYNFELYKARLEAAGMSDLADDYFKASGALAVICYREDIESAIRTSGFGGFQMLDLQDFPGQGTALVGILDSYLDSKGLITPEKWREFCNDVVPLLRYENHTWTTSQCFQAKVVVANYGANDIYQPVRWELTDIAGKQIATGELALFKILQGELTELGNISVNLEFVTAPQKLTVTLTIPGTEYRNSYSIWVYPDQDKPLLSNSVKVFSSLSEEAKDVLGKGGKVLILPAKEAIPTSIDGAFQTDFWCYAMFRKYNPPGTLGILCDPKHPSLNEFPTDFHADWQWWRLLKFGRPINLATLPRDYRPIIQVIDNVTLNRKLGILFEAKVGAGSLLVCSMDLQRQQEYPEGRQMLASLLKYMDSEAFCPEYILRMEDLETIIKE